MGLEIGPWKLDLGNWALENVPLEYGVHANLYPCYLHPLVVHHLGIPHPWKRDALQSWCLAENPLEKRSFEFLPLEISVNRCKESITPEILQQRNILVLIYILHGGN